MKNAFSLSIFLAALSLLLACNSKQTADQCLQDDNQRKDIIVAIAHHPTHAMEMMHEMIASDTLKQMLGQTMMSDPGMMNMTMDNMMSMCAKDTSICKMMMSKTMEMCDANESMHKMMIGSMQSHPNVMKSMKGMCDMNNMNMGSKNDPTHEHPKNE
ncbi:MAG: hypothetical protein SH808_03745 [Saprospiraceae bacterium]|nr:hypothetical protein [Saprospiraceae bacterium]